MRFNEKLNGLFKISENQKKFKDLIDESEKIIETGDIEEEIEVPKPKILGRILGMMRVLSYFGIDISNIDKNTKWLDIKSQIGEDKIETILDAIYLNTGIRIEDDYKLGLYIISARNAFWHREVENKVSKNTKKLFNSATDKFFQEHTFDDLYKIGFFKDLEKNGEKGLVDSRGFVIGGCVKLDEFYGYNIRTGTKFTKENTLGVDIDDFTRSGVNSLTNLRYNTNFFRFDKQSNSWINLHTGKDEDLLGYNHEGIRVNESKGRLGFDRDGLWHKKLKDGTYSKEGQEFDDIGKDVYGFSKKQSSSVPINRWYKVRRKDGRIEYLFNGEDGSYTDYDGFGIDGFNEQGFNRDGIHRDTGIKYNRSGISFSLDGKRKFTFPLIDALKQKDQTKLVEFIILSKINPYLEVTEMWYQLAKSKVGDVNENLYKICDEIKIANELDVNWLRERDNKADNQLFEEQKRNEELVIMMTDYSKLLAILKGNWNKVQRNGER